MFRVAKINADGTTLATKMLEGTGWNEDDIWVRLAASPGCVAFPGVWTDGGAPYARYGNQGPHLGYPPAAVPPFSATLHITTICDVPDATALRPA